MPDKALLEINNLLLSYSGHAVLKHINLSINKGETLGLVGESGSGKSQTALAIMRLLSPAAYIDNGSVLWQDAATGKTTDVLKLTEKAMQGFRGRQAGMIFQDPQTALNPVLTCGYQVDEAIMVHSHCSRAEAKKQALALFAEVQLPDPARIYTSYPHQLSGGQKQRVMIAMAVSCKPQLLIADEPTTALDVTVQASVLKLLNNLRQQQGMSMLFISHDLAVVGQVADRVAVMYHGEVVECDTVYNIFNNPQHPYTKALLACRPAEEHAVKRLPVMAQFLDKDVEPYVLKDNILTDDMRSARQQQLYTHNNPILTIDNLTTRYGTRHNIWGSTTQWLNAVDDVSIDIYKGETLGIVGESGSGKSTLGRTIMRLVDAASGSITYNSKRIDTMNGEALRHFRRKIQVIFQDSYAAMDPLMTAAETVAEPLLVHNICATKAAMQQRIKELFSQVGLSDELADRLPHQLSGGQRQRVCIARALALQPEVIICDESVSALDVSLQAQVLNLLADLRDTYQLTYIFITHDLNVVSHFCDRVVVMQKGKVVEKGFAVDVLHNPQQLYTQQLVAAIPKLMVNVELAKSRFHES